MDQIYNFFIGNTASNYVEAGFSDRKAQAMTWMSQQKPQGKFYGALGSFLAFTWGHFHERISGNSASNAIELYPTGDPWANILKYSIEDSLKRKSSFNQRALALRFNQRALALRSNIPLQNRKRIFNPHIETEDEFQRRRKLNLTAPWEDAKIREVIKAENSEKGENIIYGPKGLDKLIDDLEKN